MTDLVARVRAAIDETEAWARAASQPYKYADEGSTVPEGGVRWRWVTGENWDPVTPDPVTMELLEGPDGSWHANLATVEEWPSTMRIDDERTRTDMMPRTYANSIDEMDPAAAGHIARHDPAAALRRCAADRKILDLHVPAAPPEVPSGWVYCTTCGSGEPYEYPTDWPCETVTLLAEAYGVEGGNDG